MDYSEEGILHAHHWQTTAIVIEKEKRVFFCSVPVNKKTRRHEGTRATTAVLGRSLSETGKKIEDTHGL